jgi:alpha-mannosidase
VQIRDIHSTDLFTGTQRHPLQILRVTLAGPLPNTAIRVDGTGIATPEPVPVADLAQDEERVVEVPVAVDPSLPAGTTRRVTVTAGTGDPGTTGSADGELTVEAPGWTMFMVSHFHYDPVWWNTQAGYASTWDDLPTAAQERRMAGQEPAFHLVRAHLETALKDADYKFVLAELDYLRPYWDACPQDRAALRELIADGRVELVGGMYNEPNTNLTSLESTIRNVIYGVGYQRDVVGGDPRTGWMLDVFGHDPGYPAIMADAGLTSNSWARGPFHQWGPVLTTGSSDGMQFPSEFEWISPDGSGLLTSYMTSHYSAGWRLDALPGLAEAEDEAYAQFQILKNRAFTHNVVLPVGADHVIPSRWVTEIHRDWNRRYVWPRFVCATPAEFFAAVRGEAGRRGQRLSPQSRDMNPLYTGKDVSYIDTKQAQRAIEVALLEGEKLATLMSLLGAPFPAEAVDRAWRLMCFGAHHDGITGTESDQVYLDLLGGWREAWELAAGVRDDAARFLTRQVDTRGEGDALVVINTLSSPRTDVVTAKSVAAAVHDDQGRPVPTVATGDSISFVASDVPATGYRTYRLVPAPRAGWRRVPGFRAENDAFLVEADPARGGALTRVLDKRTGKELLRAGSVGNELVLHDEYPAHPDFQEGPWHLVPTGTRVGTASVAGAVRAEASAAGERLVTSGRLGDLVITSEVTLWGGVDRIEFRTHVDGSIGQDHLLRVRFPLDVAGARPLYETGHAVIGRTFGWPDVDAARHPWTQDNPAYGWAGLSSAVRVVTDGGAQAIGVAEIVAAADADGLRELVAALAGQGVTATTSEPDGPRYGGLDLDSNLPDVRISIGGPDENEFTARVLAAADLSARPGLLWVPADRTRAQTWVPGADVRGDRDLPVLIVAGAVADLIADLADATIDAGPGEVTEPLEDYSIGLLNRGTPGTVVEPDGTMHLSLMRACSGWPSGVWIDPPKRTAPDGSSFSWQHWSHTFEYAITAGPGDWRAAGLVQAALAYNHRLLAVAADAHDGGLPGSASLLAAEPANVVVTAVKPAGNPLAAGRPAGTGGGLAVRCSEAAGRPVTARVRCFVPFREVAVTNILEEPAAAVPAPDGELRFELSPAQTRTVLATPVTSLAPSARSASDAPDFASYWLHNAGPAPAGHQPVTVYVEPRSADLSGPVRVQVTVSTTHGATGSVELAVPPGIDVSTGDLGYQLGPDGYQRFEVLVEPRGQVPPGSYHLAARVGAEYGRIIEDVVTLRAGGPGPELEAQLDPPALTVHPGGTAELRLRLTNRCQDEVRGRALLVSPFGSWDLTAPWARDFTAAPGADSVLTFQITAPAGARPMTTWLLAKVMAFGTVHYTEAVPLSVTQG